MSSSIYMERNKSFKYTLFLNYKVTELSKTIFIIVLNTHHLLLLTIHKNILFFTKFFEKKSTIESLYLMSSVGS